MFVQKSKLCPKIGIVSKSSPSGLLRYAVFNSACRHSTINSQVKYRCYIILTSNCTSEHHFKRNAPRFFNPWQNLYQIIAFYPQIRVVIIGTGVFFLLLLMKKWATKIVRSARKLLADILSCRYFTCGQSQLPIFFRHSYLQIFFATKNVRKSGFSADNGDRQIMR